MAFHNVWDHRFEVSPGKWIFVPSLESRKRGRHIKNFVLEKWRPPSFYYHLAVGGHVSGLKCHLNNKFFATLDIDNFFGSINRSRVTRCLKALAGYEVAREMANDSIVRLPQCDPVKYMLPFGFVQSPILATLCLDQSKLGGYFRELARTKSVRLSVYMDDIVVSSSSEEKLRPVVAQIKKMATAARWVLNEKKEHAPAETVQAFNIQLSSHNLEICKPRLQDFLTV